MKKIKKNNSENGFAIALSVLLLVLMSLMGASLIMVTSNDHKQNSKRDEYQQAFYAAETAISFAKQMLVDHVDTKKVLPAKNSTPNLIPQNASNYCKTSLFSSLEKSSTIYYVPVQGMSATNYDNRTLSSVIEANNNPDESKRLAKYSYYFFITYAPDQSGNTSTENIKTVSSSSGSGSSAAVGTSYKNQGSSQAYYYSIFACGKGEDNTIVALDSIVAIVK